MLRRFIIAAVVAILSGEPLVAQAQTSPADDPQLLHLFGLQRTYMVDGQTQKLSDLAARQAARVEAERARAAAAAPPAPPLAAPPPPLIPAPGAPRAPIMVEAAPAPPPPPPPQAKTPPSLPEAAAVVWNFVTQFARVCRDGWKSGTHTCYADVTSGTPAAWSAPPTSSAPPEVGPDDPNATPPPLMSVMTAGAVHPAQIVLADQVTALAKLAPDSGAADAPPPEIAKALHRAEQRPGIIRGTTIPAVTVSRTGVVNLNNGDFVSLAFSAAVAAPDFGTPGKSAAYGSRASSAVTFDLLLTLAGRPISYRNQLATLQAAVTAPLTGTSPTITIETTALGTQSNKTIRYAGKERALHYSEVRRQQVREDLCALSESVPLAQGVDIDLKLACPALFGYALVVDAVPKQASVQMAPIANVGMELSADVSAAGGLLTIGAITDADLITAQARVGAYANFVADPNPVGPTASRADRFIALRPYEFATVKAGDGFIYIVLKAAGTTTYIKVYEWDPLYRADLDDGGSLSVYRLTRP